MRRKSEYGERGRQLQQPPQPQLQLNRRHRCSRRRRRSTLSGSVTKLADLWARGFLNDAELSGAKALARRSQLKAEAHTTILGPTRDQRCGEGPARTKA